MTSYIMRINRENTPHLLRLSEATRHHPAKVANMLIEYALKHVRLKPTTATVYDISFFQHTVAPSRQNTMNIFPQMADIYSGLRTDKQEG